MRHGRRQRDGDDKRQGRNGSLTERGTAANWPTTEAVERPTAATVIPIPARRFHHTVASSQLTTTATTATVNTATTTTTSHG